MKEKAKKIITTTLLSALSVTAVGCGVTGNKLAKNIDKSMAQFVSSVNNLDYVETTKSANEKIGKIVETNATDYVGEKRILTDQNQVKFLNNNISEAEIENTITRPSERQDDFKLFILSDTPFISLSSDGDEKNFSISVKISTDKIEETSTEIDQKINTLILKRSILMIYVNEIYNGNVILSDENKTSINAYVNIIKENASFLNGNRGMVKNQLKLAKDLAEKNSNESLVNYYMIKSNEALETRASKFDSTISAIDSIINIIEQNLTSSSNFYNTKLSSSYENFIANHTQNYQNSNQISSNSSNKEIADTIFDSLSCLNKLEKSYKNININNSGSENKNITQSSENNQSNKNEENGIMTLPLTENNRVSVNGNTSQPQQITNQNTSNIQSPITSNNGSLNFNGGQTQINTSNQNNLSQSGRVQNYPESSTNNRLSQNQSGNLQRNNNRSNVNSHIRPNNTSRRERVSQNINIPRTSTPSSQISNTPNHLGTNTRNQYDQNVNSHTTLNNGDFNQNDNHIKITNNQARRSRNMQSNTNGDKTMRAERTPERVTNEEYTSGTLNSDLRGIRLPYRSTNNRN